MRKRLNRPKNQLRIETRKMKIKREGGDEGEGYGAANSD